MSQLTESETSSPNGSKPQSATSLSSDASNHAASLENDPTESNNTNNNQSSSNVSNQSQTDSKQDTSNNTNDNTSNNNSNKDDNFEYLQPGVLKHLEVDEFFTDEDEVEKHCIEQTWSNCDSTTFEVRRGPDYKPNSNQKAPSAKALYSVFAIDAYKSPFKIHKLSQFVDLTSKINELNKFNKEYSYNKWPLPPIIIINFMIPNYTPSVFGADKTDGEGYQVTVYAEMTEETRNNLLKLYNGDINYDELLPSIRLLSRFIHASETRDSNCNFINNNIDINSINKHGLTQKEIDETLDRFKIIIRTMNYSHTQMPYALHPIIKNYNAKPFLARTSSTFYHEPGQYFAIDIDAHVFGKLARKSLGYLKGCMETVIFDGGFVIEGRDNDELPEQVLCSARISKTGMSVCTPLPKRILTEYLRRKSNNTHMNAKFDINCDNKKFAKSMINLRDVDNNNNNNKDETLCESKNDSASKTVPVIERDDIKNVIKDKSNINNNNNNNNVIEENDNGTSEDKMDNSEENELTKTNGIHATEAAT